MAWRHWRRSRPFWGGLWAILGGLLMMYGPLTAVRLILVAGQVVWVGIAFGALVSVFGLFVWFAPSLRHITAVLIVLLSVASFITSDFGGFLIGMILGIVGGSLAFGWTPVELWRPPTWRRRARREWKLQRRALKLARASAFSGTTEAPRVIEVTGRPVDVPAPTVVPLEGELAVSEAPGGAPAIEKMGEEVERVPLAESVTADEATAARHRRFPLRRLRR